MSLLSVPGNLLIAGEYAVLEEGGLGIAMAVEPRVEVRVHQESGFTVEGTWGDGRRTWTPESRPESDRDLIAAVVDEVAADADALPDGVRVEVDSRALYGGDGSTRKSGLGSSAAVCVGLACALLEVQGIPRTEIPSAAFGVCLRAHRRAQGGRGSGYDVAASLYGGRGVFTGGAAPVWTPADLAWYGRGWLFPGPAAVATPGATRRYSKWKGDHPRDARDFLERSNFLVRRLCECTTWAEAGRIFAEITARGVRLGQHIGTPADITEPEDSAGALCKALGAGNEAGIAIVSPRDRRDAVLGATPVAVSEQGVLWNG